MAINIVDSAPVEFANGSAVEQGCIRILKIVTRPNKAGEVTTTYILQEVRNEGRLVRTNPGVGGTLEGARRAADAEYGTSFLARSKPLVSATARLPRSVYSQYTGTSRK